MAKCSARIEFGDDWGDNGCTFHCELEEGHNGSHQEKGDMGHRTYSMPYTLTWEGNQSDSDKILFGDTLDRENKS